MWLFCKAGFFSVVEGYDGEQLMVRARVREDLERLRDEYAPLLGPTVTEGGTDYPYRAFIAHDDWGAVMARIGQDIDYSNFKDMVDETQGRARHDLYARVWAVMNGAEDKLRR